MRIVYAVIIIIAVAINLLSLRGYSVESEIQEKAVKQYSYTENLMRFEAIDQQLAESIEQLCSDLTENKTLCIKHIIGVTSAESSNFKRCSKNNCFGLMKCTSKGCSLRKYSSKEESIEDWLKLYNKNKWYNRLTGQSRLDGRYCTSACSHWTKNYNGAIHKLGIW